MAKLETISVPEYKLTLSGEEELALKTLIGSMSRFQINDYLSRGSNSLITDNPSKFTDSLIHIYDELKK